MITKRYDDLILECTDQDTGVSVKFVDGLFNETQNFSCPEHLTHEDLNPLKLAREANRIGDYLANEHSSSATCRIKYRMSVIRFLPDPEYWIALERVLDKDISCKQRTSTDLLCAIKDYLEKHEDDCMKEQLKSIQSKFNTARDIFEAESLVDGMAREIFLLIDSYHNFDATYNDTECWARNIILWSSSLAVRDSLPNSIDLFGRMLKQVRESRKMSLADLAKKSGVDISLLSKIENGKVNPTLSNLIKIGNGLGCSLEYKSGNDK